MHATYLNLKLYADISRSSPTRYSKARIPFRAAQSDSFVLERGLISPVRFVVQKKDSFLSRTLLIGPDTVMWACHIPQNGPPNSNRVGGVDVPYKGQIDSKLVYTSLLYRSKEWYLSPNASSRRHSSGWILLLCCLLLLLSSGVQAQHDSQTVVEEGEDNTGYKDHTYSGKWLTNGEYPMTTLSCYSSYTKPDGELICPEARSKYCVKELSTLKQDLCGESQYFGDQYLDNLCVLRKCAATCEEGQYPFEYGGLEYVRVRYCCMSNYCNSTSRRFGDPRKAVIFLSVLSLTCMFFL